MTRFMDIHTKSNMTDCIWLNCPILDIFVTDDIFSDNSPCFANANYCWQIQQINISQLISDKFEIFECFAYLSTSLKGRGGELFGTRTASLLNMSPSNQGFPLTWQGDKSWVIVWNFR